MKMFFRVPEDKTFSEIHQALASVKGLVTVAKLPGENGREEGLAEFENETAADEGIAILEKSGGEVIAQPSGSESNPTLATSKAKRGAKKADNADTKKFFSDVPTYHESKDAKQRAQRDEEQQRGGNRGGNDRNRNQRNHGENGQGRGRGGYSRGRGGRGRGRGGRGGYHRGARPGYVMPRFVEGHIASIHGVPVSMTNDQIAEAFNECGTIYDIARYENLAMVYFDSAASVLEAICKVNGQKLNGSVVTVSDGGTLRVPIPQPPPQVIY